MFTGLIEEIGMVSALDAGAGGSTIAIDASFAGEVKNGDSVAVSGACLTVVGHDEGTMIFEVMHESLRRTALAGLRPGRKVNLERALRADARLGGHLVSGHVDAVGHVLSVQPDGFARVLRIGADERLLRLIVEKGSVCIDGVSLTVADVDEHGLSVSLIPETLDRTTLGELCAEPEERVVNLETDILAKHVEKLLAATLPAQVAAAMTGTAAARSANPSGTQ